MMAVFVIMQRECSSRGCWMLRLIAQVVGWFFGCKNRRAMEGSSRSGLHSPKAASCGEVWTEYEELSRDSILKATETKSYTAGTLLRLLRLVAPKMMRRAEAHFSHGVAENLDDLKYERYKYWSNPLETRLPNALNMEIYCMYGVGIPTERSDVYKLSPSSKCRSIPLRIDSSENGRSENGCLRGGVYFVDGFHVC